MCTKIALLTKYQEDGRAGWPQSQAQKYFWDHNKLAKLLGWNSRLCFGSILRSSDSQQCVEIWETYNASSLLRWHQLDSDLNWIWLWYYSTQQMAGFFNFAPAGKYIFQLSPWLEQIILNRQKIHFVSDSGLACRQAELQCSSLTFNLINFNLIQFYLI